MAPGKWKMDVERMLEQVDENTIVVVPTFGVTYTGAYEFPGYLMKRKVWKRCGRSGKPFCLRVSTRIRYRRSSCGRQS